MKAFFSKRHREALKSKKLRPHIPSSCRTAIKRLLEKYSDYSVESYSEVNDTFISVENELKTFWGVNKLMAFGNNDNRVPATLPEVIENGYPSEVLDIIESWFNQQPNEASVCEKELNDIFSINDSEWRVINGQVMLVDSEYLHREVHLKNIRLLEECEIPGALEEFQDAINDLTSGNTKEAVVNAHKSVESVMKAVLETNEHSTFGALLDKLIKSNIVPNYYDEFLKNFEKLMLGVSKERNLPARGHGQGRNSTSVAPCLAEFTVNLAGAINVFIIKHWIELKQPPSKEKEVSNGGNIPF